MPSSTHASEVNNDKIYIVLVTAVFVGMAAVFLCLPRSTYSTLEKRDLAEFPALPDTLNGRTLSAYTAGLSTWFSDTEPLRDQFMSASMGLRRMMRLNVGGEDNITVVAAPQAPAKRPAAVGAPGTQAASRTLPEQQEDEAIEGVAKIGAAGILLVGSEPEVRALMAYKGEATGGGRLVKAVNRYAGLLGPKGVKVHCMVVPNATEFYLPTSARARSYSQLATIRNIYSHLDSTVTAVDAYTPLRNHRHEDIYLRTDHHWAPLGAYYAAQELARVLKVPFPDLSTYEKRTVKRFVGSMYGYSRDESVKRSAEDFVSYEPTGLDYATTFVDYTVDKDYHVTNAGKPRKGEYFYHYKDGSGLAYGTFMGGDQRLTKVETGSGQPRRLLVIKDSYGNALPGYLFHSFGQVHVVDFRYFDRKIVKYAADNGITDLLIVFNVFNAYSPTIDKRLLGFLE